VRENVALRANKRTSSRITQDTEYFYSIPKARQPADSTAFSIPGLRLGLRSDPDAQKIFQRMPAVAVQ
jgi:hypothetical protein